MTNKIIAFCLAILLLSISAYLSYRKEKYLKTLGILGTIFGVSYWIWRVLYTIPLTYDFGMLMGIILIVVELIALENSLTIKLLFSSNRLQKLPNENRFHSLPDVDVFITTYNEPMEILKRTIVSAVNINYPLNKLHIYIGDDQKRAEIQKLCAELKVNYLTRKDNSHAKAGNLNNLLQHSTSPYILTLDADMIPHKEIINQMIHYFTDEQTGFVQSPQVFYNSDIWQYNLNISEEIPNEQDFFMRTILEKRAKFNAVLHVGCNAIFSRKAIENIGGIPTSSITEDMATGMLIQAQGYQSYFVNQALAVGLAVDSVTDLIKQRERWLKGSIQVFKKHNPFKLKGLNIWQKLIYFDGLLYWTFGLNKIVYILAPLLYLLFRTRLFVANGFDLVFMFFPYFLSNIYYFKIISKQGRNVTWSHIYETTIAPSMAYTFLSELFFNSKLKFKVTPKGMVLAKNKLNVRYGVFHYIIFLLSIIALIINVKYLSWSNLMANSALLINLIWCVYNLLAVTISIFILIDRKRYRKVERIPVNFLAKAVIDNCQLDGTCKQCGSVLDISDLGAYILLDKPLTSSIYQLDNEIMIDIEHVGIIRCLIVRLVDGDKHLKLGVQFLDLGINEFDKINVYRFYEKRNYLKRKKISQKMNDFKDILKQVVKFKHKNI